MKYTDAFVLLVKEERLIDVGRFYGNEMNLEKPL
jgi:hypothetical protein